MCNSMGIMSYRSRGKGLSYSSVFHNTHTVAHTCAPPSSAVFPDYTPTGPRRLIYAQYILSVNQTPGACRGVIREDRR
jgi:hypothetical protein